MTRNDRIIKRMAHRCDVMCIAGIITAFIGIALMAAQLICYEPFTPLPIALACSGIAVCGACTYVGKTIEEVK